MYNVFVDFWRDGYITLVEISIWFQGREHRDRIMIRIENFSKQNRFVIIGLSFFFSVRQYFSQQWV